MVIGKYLLEFLGILIALSIVSTLVMYYFGIGSRAKARKNRNIARHTDRGR